MVLPLEVSRTRRQRIDNKSISHLRDSSPPREKRIHWSIHLELNKSLSLDAIIPIGKQTEAWIRRRGKNANRSKRIYVHRKKMQL